MNTSRPYCLSLAGFDPTAGAGVLADVKTFEMLGVYGMGIITANTLQTDDEFIAVDWVDVAVVKRQLETLLKKYDFDVIKIGLVENFEMLYECISLAKNIRPALKIIWDPILTSSSGFNFHDPDSLELGFLEENCTLITPNWNEFQNLWGEDVRIFNDHKLAASVLIKGGHRLEKTGCDLLVNKGVSIEIAGSLFCGKSKHGTGCVLSAAIAAYLALGHSLIDSCIAGKTYVEKFILSNESNLGYHYTPQNYMI